MRSDARWTLASTYHSPKCARWTSRLPPGFHLLSLFTRWCFGQIGVALGVARKAYLAQSCQEAGNSIRLSRTADLLASPIFKAVEAYSDMGHVCVSRTVHCPLPKRRPAVWAVGISEVGHGHSSIQMLLGCPDGQALWKYGYKPTGVDPIAFRPIQRS